jgi:hypothetical protein
MLQKCITHISLSHVYSTQVNQTTEVTKCDIRRRVIEPLNSTVIFLFLIGSVNFAFEKQACQLAMVNMAIVNSDNGRVYGDKVRVL